MSRNTQGGLGHRLRGRRGGKSAAPTPAVQQWRRRPKGEIEQQRGQKKNGEDWVGRGFGLVTLQSRRPRKDEKRQRWRKKRNTAAERKARECGKAAPEMPVFIARGRGLMTSQPAGCRASGAEQGCGPGRREGAEEKGVRRGQRGWGRKGAVRATLRAGAQRLWLPALPRAVAPHPAEPRALGRGRARGKGRAGAGAQRHPRLQAPGAYAPACGWSRRGGSWARRPGGPDFQSRAGPGAAALVHRLGRL